MNDLTIPGNDVESKQFIEELNARAANGEAQALTDEQIEELVDKLKTLTVYPDQHTDATMALAALSANLGPGPISCLMDTVPVTPRPVEAPTPEPDDYYGEPPEPEPAPTLTLPEPEIVQQAASPEVDYPPVEKKKPESAQQTSPAQQWRGPVYVDEWNAFYNRFQNRIIPEREIRRTVQVPRGDDPIQWFFDSGAALYGVNRFKSARYAPEGFSWSDREDEFAEQTGGTRDALILNTWQEPIVSPVESPEDLALWLKLLEHLIPCPEARQHVIYYLATLVQRPDLRINHGLLLAGGQGIGKDCLFIPMREILGENNVKTLFGKDLIEDRRRDYLLGTKLLIVPEVTNVGDKLQADFMKSLLAAPPAQIEVNGRLIDNIFQMIMMSNSGHPVTLEKDDRRYFAIWSDAERLPDDFYADLFLGYGIDGAGKRNQEWDAPVTYALFAYLSDEVDISGFNPHAPPPWTDFKRTLVRGAHDAESETGLVLRAAEAFGTEPFRMNALQDRLHRVEIDLSDHKVGAILKASRRYYKLRPWVKGQKKRPFCWKRYR